MLKVAGLFTEYPNERGEIVKAAQDVTFEVPEGKLFTLLGPSGCGKTTTLRSIAGLERPRAGEISVGDRVVFSSTRNVFVAPNRRGFGMVFQSYAIWPHMNVFQNAAFPLEVGDRRFSRQEIRDKVLRVLKAVQLDEPLSNLDAKLRERMRFELKRLQRELRITTVYVTHDQSEALALSHSIAVMNEGHIQQIGAPREIYERPRSQFVADFVGTTNFLDGTVLGRGAEPGHFRVRTEFGEVEVLSDDDLRGSDRVVLSVRPEDVELAETRPAGDNVWDARVDQKVFLGEFIDFQVKLGGRILLARTHPSLRTPVGDPIYVKLHPEKCVALKAA